MQNMKSENDSSSSSSLSSVSSKSDKNDETDLSDNKTSRFKRGIAWCGVDTSVMRKPEITWPPPQNNSPSTSFSHNWSNLRHVRLGNPLYGAKMQLYSKTRQHLAVYPDGTVRGTKDDNDLHTYLELISAGMSGHIRIKGLLTFLYVAMDKKGRLYGESDFNEESTIFIESFQGSYNTYLSKKYAHLGWFLGLKKSGKGKRGPKTNFRQKAVQFLPRRSRFQ